MRLALLAACAAAVLFAQERPTFDVISVKHAGDVQSTLVQSNTATRSRMRPPQFTPGGFFCFTTLQSILLDVFQVKPFQLEAPDWVSSEVYDFNARMPEGTSRETARLMILAALEDRLGLKVHRHDKEFSVLLLKVIPGTNKLEEILPRPNGFSVRFNNTMLEGNPGLPMGSIVGTLTRAAGKPVIDETGKSGMYKVNLRWEPNEPSDTPPGVARYDNSGILSAISQIGLKLEPARRVLESIAIEKLSKEPTEN